MPSTLKPQYRSGPDHKKSQLLPLVFLSARRVGRGSHDGESHGCAASGTSEALSWLVLLG